MIKKSDSRPLYYLFPATHKYDLGYEKTIVADYIKKFENFALLYVLNKILVIFTSGNAVPFAERRKPPQH